MYDSHIGLQQYVSHDHALWCPSPMISSHLFTQALHSSGTLDALESAGVTHIHIHSVDNALAVVPDPVLVGFTRGR